MVSELILKNERKWTKDLWINIFVENPIMRKLATGILWGIYEDKKLLNTFRYDEDGSFNTIDEEELTLDIKENNKIGIVHPMDLKEQEIKQWTELFENYEIVQPINQLNRKIFTINEIEMKSKSVERFGGKIINGIKALKILEAYGWERGPVLEGKLYLYFCKEIKESKIRIELNVNELILGTERERNTTILNLKFYKMNNELKGSYRYEDTKDSRYIIMPKDVPDRIFSETLYEIDKMLLNSTGYNKNWKRCLQ